MDVIYLNGPSSVGKTTLSRALQEALTDYYLHHSLDRVIGMMPLKSNNWDGTGQTEGFYFDGPHICFGRFGRHIIETFRQAALFFLEQGHRLIIDDIAFGKEEVDSWRLLLENRRALYVGLIAPHSTLEEREKNRGDRLIGSARMQAERVHVGVAYDLVLDTSELTLEQMVKRVLGQFNVDVEGAQ